VQCSTYCFSISIDPFITTRDRGASPLLGRAIPRPELAQLDPTKTEWPAQDTSTLTD
jgi:hypothetical protein